MEKQETSFTQGSVFLALIRFALPVLGALALQAAYGAVDLLVVGVFGDAAGISAVGTGSLFMQMVTLVIVALSMGATVVIGQFIGEGKPERAGNAVGTAIIMFLVLGVLLTVVLEAFTGGIVGLLKVPSEAIGKCVLYLRICFGGIIVIIAYNVISSILRGVGNSGLPFIFVGIACVVNIAGDLLFVGVFGLDAAGAAIATVLAQTVSVIVSIPIIKMKKLPIKFSLKQLRVYKRELVRILRVGIPTASEEFVVQISFLVVNGIINNMGLMQSAGYGVAEKIITFIMLIPSTIMNSVSAFTAQNIGAGKVKRAKKGFFTAIFTGSAVGIVIFCIGFFGGGLISGLFTSDPEVIIQSADYLKGFSADCILTCTLFSCIGYFTGCGVSLPVFLQGASSAFLLRIPLSVFFSRLPNTNLVYMGTATPITTVYGIFFFALMFYIYRRRGKAVI